MNLDSQVIYSLAAKSVFGIISLICLIIHLWRYDAKKTSPYLFLFIAFWCACNGIGNRSISKLLWESRYAKYIPESQLERSIISTILLVLVTISVQAILKWSVTKYKKHLKDKHGNIPSNQNRSDG
jgi:hypothetical protein